MSNLLKRLPRRRQFLLTSLLLLAAAGLGVWIYLTKPGSPRAVLARASE